MRNGVINEQLVSWQLALYVYACRPCTPTLSLSTPPSSRCVRWAVQRVPHFAAYHLGLLS
jgi:hypothetical protein